MSGNNSELDQATLKAIEGFLDNTLGNILHLDDEDEDEDDITVAYSSNNSPTSNSITSNSPTSGKKIDQDDIIEAQLDYFHKHSSGIRDFLHDNTSSTDLLDDHIDAEYLAGQLYEALEQEEKMLQRLEDLADAQVGEENAHRVVASVLNKLVKGVITKYRAEIADIQCPGVRKVGDHYMLDTRLKPIRIRCAFDTHEHAAIGYLYVDEIRQQRAAAATRSTAPINISKSHTSAYYTELHNKLDTRLQFYKKQGIDIAGKIDTYIAEAEAKLNSDSKNRRSKRMKRT